MCEACGKPTTFVTEEEDYLNECVHDVFECFFCGNIEYILSEEYDEV
ncbi:hypothetical protein [Vibrio phage vB_VpaP_SJSY21]|nr:hypothetical protein [Vibrio phage vB_VpaP_SJSY21]